LNLLKQAIYYLEVRKDNTMIIWNKRTIPLFVLMLIILIFSTIIFLFSFGIPGLWPASTLLFLILSNFTVFWTMLQVAKQKMSKIIQLILIIIVVSLTITLYLISLNIAPRYVILFLGLYPISLILNSIFFWNTRIKNVY